MPLHAALQDSYLGYAAIYVCLGVGFLYLRRVAEGAPGTGCWTAGFLLNAAGFLLWTQDGPAQVRWYFAAGDLLHVLGFAALLLGVRRFMGLRLGRRPAAGLAAVGGSWLLAMALLAGGGTAWFVPYTLVRTTLFVWAGWVVLGAAPGTSAYGRGLAGWGLIAWGVYALAFPVFARLGFVPFRLGFLVGFQVLVAVGLAVLVLDRMRLRAEASEAEVRRLEGLLPICAHCKKIRDEHGAWQRIETYVADRSEAVFSHGICDDCLEEHYPALGD